MVTLIELKKEKMLALKNHDSDKMNVLGIVISSLQKLEIEKKAAGKEITEVEMVSILNKTIKELTDEKAMYEANGRAEQALSDHRQIEIIKAYLPKMMEEDEIRKVIESLPDHQIKTIMQAFKKDYAGKADMALVNKIAREYQG
ncbi:MAG: GatB/YqeY domain-containing protein [bacterium]|nr:GatB/YqeY domain-containing protein [Bacilli bacterium]MDD7213285.1 GatB/YqeY domain-containing protein [bacterium]MDD7328983.1 GatB/YqeY domain-containing protein [bacterium]MDY2895530.1 GatB/YqeY domain-containing protein [Candidatus Enterosoma sp.]MDY5548575.1 GatB/YqeY domain-containing protein [Candidatus Enterosoma sp.]